MILSLTYYGNKVLRTKCRKVEKITDEIKKIVSDMIETMDAKKGIGLAAPQVGIDLCIFILRNEVQGPNGEFLLGDWQAYINPKLSNPLSEKGILSEGCLSFPGLHIDIERPNGITVEATDINGKVFTEVLVGFKSRVVMHENDHINGTLYIDRASKQDRARIEPIINEIKRKYNS